MAICIQCGETMRNCSCGAILTNEREIEEEYREIDKNIELAIIYQNQN